MITITGAAFLTNIMNWNADKLAILFMAAYERPSYDPSINHYNLRQQYALEWANYMGAATFTPRLDDTGIQGDFHYYSDNPYYQSGYGMPNCTCYAWGRFWEIGDPSDTGANKPTHLPVSNGGQWFNDAVQDGTYETGQTPRLGAVICFSDNNGGSGHVAIVEEIASDGTLTCSNSAWQGTYFFLSYITPVNNTYNWSHYTCQGFIYNPYAYQPVPPSPTPSKKRGFPWPVLMRKIKYNKLRK